MSKHIILEYAKNLAKQRGSELDFSYIEYRMNQDIANENSHIKWLLEKLTYYKIKAIIRI
jgi:hypothetical protein